MGDHQIEYGEYAVCGECNRARRIVKPVVELFDYRVGFGPGGETDMFSEHDGDVLCYRCIHESTDDIPVGVDIATQEKTNDDI